MSPSWLRPGGLEVEILKIDETELEPQVEVRIKATGEVETVPLGKITSSQGDVEVYRQADEVVRD